ncbi:MAG: GMC family oxidoreductase N-terminal domain-containing protein [Chitinophagaceae bacterium]|nr:GMC family oxidoreductase N-terminal domain-containing protein [Chitinophagaceae bacterium]
MPFDYIIIGAGSAGCVLASRLTEDPACKVLLIEAGPADKKIEIQIPGAYTKLNRTAVDWSFWTEPQKHLGNRRLYIPRGKTLGGSSATNAMAYVRGNRADYDEWASLGNEGWGYEDLLPYFKRSENHEQFGEPFHGEGGPLNITLSRQPSLLAPVFVEACEACGIPRNNDYNGAQQDGAGMLQFTIRKNKRHSCAAAFLRPAMRRSNLTVRTNTYVRRILIEHGRAEGVEVMTGYAESERINCTKEIILAAGAIQSPHVLMLSGIGDPLELGKQGIDTMFPLPGVGKNLQDHVWSGVTCMSAIPTANSLLRPWNMGLALMQHLLFRSGPLANSPIEANAFLKSDPALNRPDIQFHFVPLGIASDYSTDLYDLKTFSRQDGFGIMAILLRPESRGYVGLRSSKPKDPPVIQPNLLSAPADRKILLTALKRAMEVINTPCLAGYALDGTVFPTADASDEWLSGHIDKSLETLYHPVGTCKMGNDALSVVDDQLRVHGIKCLRVIDASVMPTIPSGNTNAAAIMIGEKGADLVRSKPLVKSGVRSLE